MVGLCYKALELSVSWFATRKTVVLEPKILSSTFSMKTRMMLENPQRRQNHPPWNKRKCNLPKTYRWLQSTPMTIWGRLWLNCNSYVIQSTKKSLIHHSPNKSFDKQQKSWCVPFTSNWHIVTMWGSTFWYMMHLVPTWHRTQDRLIDISLKCSITIYHQQSRLQLVCCICLQLYSLCLKHIEVSSQFHDLALDLKQR